MRVKLSPHVQREIIRIRQKDKQLAQRIRKQIKLFEESPKHPSLRIHKLAGTMDNMWSISVTMQIRMVYLLIDENNVLIIKIGTHDQVYRT